MFTPDMKCVRRCQDAGYFMIEDDFGNQKCVDMQNSILATDYCNSLISGCKACYVDTDGNPVCTATFEGSFLRTWTENGTLMSQVLSQSQCENTVGFSPVNMNGVWQCAACEGYWD